MKTFVQSTAFARFTVALAQGLALAWIYEAYEAKHWPATDGLIFAPLAVVALFVPVLIVAGLSNLRTRTLAIWVAAATVLSAGLTAYDIWRDPSDIAANQLRNLPTVSLWLALGAILFITHSLIMAGEADRKFLATYERHFDISWKLGVQLVLAVLFVTVLWGLLWLGTELFRLIKIEFLAELIKRRWFSVPVTAIAFAGAIHITDIRVGIVGATRTLSLALLSWLLPVMALLALAFVLALPFTGLEPLWSTRRATGILLTAAAVLVVLINSAQRDGESGSSVAAVLRYSSAVAVIVLAPLVALAGYGVALRVQQYGWTPQRIDALACVAIATCYALGYIIALARSGVSLRGLEATNVTTAFVILAVLLLLFTPIADPARISVADQLARLEAGQVAPEKFDFAFLRFQSGRYGDQALNRLKAKQDGPDAARIAQMASEALNQRNRWQAQQRQNTVRVTPATRAANIAVLRPKDQPIPDSFVAQDWTAYARQWELPRCLVADAKCEAILLDLDDDGQPEILLLGLPAGPAAAFKDGPAGWSYFGMIANLQCNGVREALRAGQFRAAAPILKEIEVAGQRLRVTSNCVQNQ
jgi:hypothetical protein